MVKIDKDSYYKAIYKSNENTTEHYYFHGRSHIKGDKGIMVHNVISHNTDKDLPDYTFNSTRYFSDVELKGITFIESDEEEYFNHLKHLNNKISTIAEGLVNSIIHRIVSNKN